MKIPASNSQWNNSYEALLLLSDSVHIRRYTPLFLLSVSVLFSAFLAGSDGKALLLFLCKNSCAYTSIKQYVLSWCPVSLQVQNIINCFCFRVHLLPGTNHYCCFHLHALLGEKHFLSDHFTLFLSVRNRFCSFLSIFLKSPSTFLVSVRFIYFQVRSTASFPTLTSFLMQSNANPQRRSKKYLDSRAVSESFSTHTL